MRSKLVELAGDDVDVSRPSRRITPSTSEPNSPRIANGDEFFSVRTRERIRCALDLLQCVGDAILDRRLVAPRDEVHDRFGVARALEDRAFRLEIAAQRIVVREVAIVSEGDRSARVVDRERLRVLEVRAARRGVADVPDRARTLELRDVGGRERRLDAVHRAVEEELLAVARCDAGGLLPAVLERVNAEVRELRGFRVPVDTEDAAHARVLAASIALRHARRLPRSGQSLIESHSEACRSPRGT